MGCIKPQKQKEAFSKLISNLNTNKVERPPSEKDIRIGYDLIQAIVFCPTMSIKLFRFVNQLLSMESLRTIIQSFVNLFQSGAPTDKTSFTLAKQFYYVLASTLNLQYGNVLLATSTNAHLQAAIRKNWPFFANNTDIVEKCLQESHCEGIQDIGKKLGTSILCFSLAKMHILTPRPHASCCCCSSITKSFGLTHYVRLTHYPQANTLSKG